VRRFNGLDHRQQSRARAQHSLHDAHRYAQYRSGGGDLTDHRHQ
jgi:hypothetical protein